MPFPGRQFFTGGVDGDTEDGLHSPIIQLKNLNNWDPINVDDIISQQGDDKAGKLCERTQGQHYQYQLAWQCGIPKINGAAFGISNYNPPADGGPAPGAYEKGWCTLHIVQYQKNQQGIGDQYAFDVVVYDNAKKTLATRQQAPVDAATKSLQVDSALPYGIILTAGETDADNVKFAYGAQEWQCGNGDAVIYYGDYAVLNHQCNFGDKSDIHGYEHGNRKGDMGFTC